MGKKKTKDQIIKSLQRENERLRDAVVWCFDEDSVPVFIQGREGEHEINTPLTAERAEIMMDSIMLDSTNTMDRVLKKVYRKTNIPLDELLKRPKDMAAFIEEVQAALGYSTYQILTRFLSLRKLGQDKGGLPRLRKGPRRKARR